LSSNENREDAWHQDSEFDPGTRRQGDRVKRWPEILIRLLFCIVLLPALAAAQDSTKTLRIGWLSPSSAASQTAILDVLRTGLRDKTANDRYQETRVTGTGRERPLAVRLSRP
jgi:hypothetical protein